MLKLIRVVHCQTVYHPYQLKHVGLPPLFLACLSSFVDTLTESSITLLLPNFI